MSKKYPFNPAKYAKEAIKYREIRLVNDGEEPACIFIPDLDLSGLKEGDKLDPDKHGEIIEEATRMNFFFEKSKESLDKKLLQKSADSFRENCFLSMVTASILGPYLFEVYVAKLKEACEERDEAELDKDSPLVKYKGTKEDGEPVYLIEINEDNVNLDDMAKKIEGFINDLLNMAKEEHGIDFYFEFVEWAWTHLVAWAMDAADEAGSNDIHAFLFDEKTFVPNTQYLMYIFAQDMARWFVEVIDVDRIDVDKLGKLLGLPRVFKARPEEAEQPPAEEETEIMALSIEVKKPFNPEYLPIPAHAAAHAVRRALSMGDKWKTEAGNDWPAFDLTNRRRSVRGLAWMRPPEDVRPEMLYGAELEQWQARMLEHARKNLDDMTADIYDAIMVEWMDKAQYAEQMVLITLDKIMEYRALKPITDGKGHRRGHQQKNKEAIDRRVMALTGVYVKFDEVTVTVEEPNGKRQQKTIQAEGPLLQVDVRYSEKKKDGKAEILGYHCRPGLPVAMGLHGSGLTYAMLARMALEMDPYREKYEKRLLRYYSYLWRTRQARGDYNRGVKVRTLLEEIGLEVETKNPNRTKERLEQALDALAKRGALAGWEYEAADEAIVGTRGWAEKWLEWRVIIEPPAFIMDHYREKINSPEPKRPALEAVDLREAIRTARKERGLTIGQAAEEIGVSKSMLSMIENGKAPIGPRVRPKLEKWLTKGLKE